MFTLKIKKETIARVEDNKVEHYGDARCPFAESGGIAVRDKICERTCALIFENLEKYTDDSMYYCPCTLFSYDIVVAKFWVAMEL